MLHRTEQLCDGVGGAGSLELDGAVAAVEDVAGQFQASGGLAYVVAEADALYGPVYDGVEPAFFGLSSVLFHVKQGRGPCGGSGGRRDRST